MRRRKKPQESVSPIVEAVRRQRWPLERRVSRILHMPSFTRPGKRGERLQQELVRLETRLLRMKPWNFTGGPVVFGDKHLFASGGVVVSESTGELCIRKS